MPGGDPNSNPKIKDLEFLVRESPMLSMREKLAPQAASPAADCTVMAQKVPSGKYNKLWLES